MFSEISPGAQTTFLYPLSPRRNLSQTFSACRNNLYFPHSEGTLEFKMTDEPKDYVLLTELAEEWGLKRSYVRKYVKNTGIEAHERRTPDAAGQRTLAVTLGEAKFLRMHRREEGFDNKTPVTSPNIGTFYIIQLIPEYNPRRLKFGFTGNLESRLKEHQTAAPTAKVLKSYPCKKTWESVVIAILVTNRCRLVRSEVFECEDLEDFSTFVDKLFALFPDPQKRPMLAEHSPFNASR